MSETPKTMEQVLLARCADLQAENADLRQQLEADNYARRLEADLAALRAERDALRASGEKADAAISAAYDELWQTYGMTPRVQALYQQMEEARAALTHHREGERDER